MTGQPGWSGRLPASRAVPGDGQAPDESSVPGDAHSPAREVQWSQGAAPRARTAKPIAGAHPWRTLTPRTPTRCSRWVPSTTSSSSGPDGNPTATEARTFTVVLGEGVLDEDWGQDEVFGKLLLTNLGSLVQVTKKTNTISHSF